MIKSLFVLLVSVTVVFGIFLCTVVSASLSSSSSPSTTGLVVRIRLRDGSMEKIQLDAGQEETLTVSDLLRPWDVAEDTIVAVRIDQKDGVAVSDPSSLKALGIRHGTLITLPPSVNNSKSPTAFSSSSSSFLAHRRRKEEAWNPYPDLANDYEQAVRKAKTRRSTAGGMSYGAVAQLQSSMHVVEPQKEGPLRRVYMCRRSAERFYANGLSKKKKGDKDGGPPSMTTATTPRFGLLIGTFQKERVDGGSSRAKKARTSLSSTTADEAYCQVAKVQAVWEPPGQQSTTKSSTNDTYDAAMASCMLTAYPRVLSLADRLGLVPVGWIYSSVAIKKDDQEKNSKSSSRFAKKKDDSTENGSGIDCDGDNAVPVSAIDVWTGCKLQIGNMKTRGLEDGDKFASVSMDATTGATEAFQLSSVSVQMVHEDLFTSISDDGSSYSTKNKKDTKLISTRHPILVDGSETTELDSVLCLINTALLSHLGSFAGTSASSSTKKSDGSLTNKAKKSMLEALNKNDERILLEQLCDFNLLLALVSSLEDEDMAEMCELVRKWTRGQKQSTKLSPKLKLKLENLLES